MNLAEGASTVPNLSGVFTGLFSGFADQFNAAVTNGVVPIAGGVIVLTIGVPLVVKFAKRLINK